MDFGAWIRLQAFFVDFCPRRRTKSEAYVVPTTKYSTSGSADASEKRKEAKSENAAMPESERKAALRGAITTAVRAAAALAHKM